MGKKDDTTCRSEKDLHKLPDCYQKEIPSEDVKGEYETPLIYRKDARVNLRVCSDDLDRLKQIAAYEGIPYQTLIASILHKYSHGRLYGKCEGVPMEEIDFSKASENL
jgi:predicted DNA binding CopG/RHH family protein